MNYDDLDAPDGSAENQGGTTQRCYFAALSTFLSIKTPIAVPVTQADLVDIVTAHTFKSGFCFLKAYITMNKGQVDLEPIGDTDGKSFKNKFKFFYPGSLSEVHGFMKRSKNDNFIFLSEKPDSGSNGYLQIGSEMFPAKLTGKFSTGVNESGTQGYEIEVEAITTAQFIYKSTISLTPAP